MKKTYLFGLALLSSVMLITSCGGGESEVDYQYNTYLSGSPTHWNVHTWQENTESIIFSYTETGLYDFVLDRDASGTPVGYKIISEMADGDPIDTQLDDNTANDLTDDEILNYAMNSSEGDTGVKWIINLNQNAKWENGEPINADTYIESMKDLLDPTMQNYRASSYYLDTLQIANAEAYYKSGRTTFEQYSKYYEEPGYNDAPYYYSFDAYNAYISTLSTEYNTIIEWFNEVALTTLDKQANTGNEALINIFSKYMTFNRVEKTDGDGKTYLGIESITLSDKQKGYHRLSTSDKDMIETLAALLGAGSQAEIDSMVDVITYLRYTWPSIEWSSVGLVKSGDYQLTLYLAVEIEEFYLKYNLAGNWIVYQPYYDGGKTTQGELTITNYATKKENYMSYGPYKLTRFQSGKSVILEKNDNWYGYSDGKHAGQYQTTRVKMEVISEHSVALQKFLKGDLDDIALTAEDIKVYGSSSRIYKTQTTYSQKLSFNTDWNALLARQTAGKNKTILTNYNFRKALSYAMDRKLFATEYTSGHIPSTVLLNSQYISDYANNEVYRETEQGKRVSIDLYTKEDGTYIENGFDPEIAKELFQKAYDEEIAKSADGSLKPNDKIEIQILLYNTESETSKAQINFLRTCLANATNGTSLEGKIDITTRKDEDYYNTAYSGNFDCIWSIWGGMTMDPYGFMQVYTKESTMCEYGFHPENEPLTIKGEYLKEENNNSDLTLTYDEWRVAIASGGRFAKGSHEVRLNILSELEKAIINRYETICFTSRAEAELVSYKVQLGSEEDLPLVGRGGIRETTYIYTASEWAKVKKSLDYKI